MAGEVRVTQDKSGATRRRHRVGTWSLLSEEEFPVLSCPISWLTPSSHGFPCFPLLLPGTRLESRLRPRRQTDGSGIDDPSFSLRI